MLLDKQQELSPFPSEEDVKHVSDAYAEYYRYSFISEKVIKFRDKNIQEWLDEFAIPEIDGHVSLDELERINYFAINYLEKVNRFNALAKSAYDLIALKYNNAYNQEKVRISNECVKNNKKPPSSEVLESYIINNIEDIYSAYKIAELFSEFWKSMQNKAKSLDGRLTSICMIHNIEKRNTKYEN
jgi:hypothetical protein